MTCPSVFKVKRKNHAIGNSNVRMNSLNQKPYETKNNNHLGRTNASRNNKNHVDRDVTLSFKVTRDDHANGDSWNEFRDLKTSVGAVQLLRNAPGGGGSAECDTL